MMALVPMGSELEKIMGSIRLLCVIIFLAISNVVLHLAITLLATYNPISSYPTPMDQRSIGFSGILFSMIVIETSFTGVQSRSLFGLFNVPAKWYVWILLVVFQLLMTDVSLLGHLCGILSGYVYTFGLFNSLIPRTSFYSSIEFTSWLQYFRTYPHIYKSKYSFKMQTTQGSDDRFPGRARTLGVGTNQATSVTNPDSSLQTRLWDDVDNLDEHSTPTRVGGGRRIPDRRPSAVNTTTTPVGMQNNQGSIATEEEIRKLIAMGFDRVKDMADRAYLVASISTPTLASFLCFLQTR